MTQSAANPIGMLEKAAEVGGEAAIMLIFRALAMRPGPMDEERVAINTDTDEIVYEMPFRVGRADIVVFHADATATVIELKDGSIGYSGVIKGIGQASLYAAQLAMARGGVRAVRKCLLWTSTGDLSTDAAIEDACLQAGTIPLPWGKLSDHLEYSIGNKASRRAEGDEASHG